MKSATSLDYRLTDRLGATHLGAAACRFEVWAPFAESVSVEIDSMLDRPAMSAALTPAPRGYFVGTVDGVEPGAHYQFELNGTLLRPDPASRSQPNGVHAASAIVDSRFDWTDQQWHGLSLSEYVIYELHVGTFTEKRTFAGVEQHLHSLRDLGITAIELMPVAQCPGTRNWGYDGVYPFAVQHSYGGPEALKQLVNAAHRAGLAIVLDVVYNHLGPEGNYLNDFGPYFTSKYQTPWGSAVNFDDSESDEVRRYFIENALQWIDEFHFDALRLDAVHAIYDNSAKPFLEELVAAVQQRGRDLGRTVCVIAESDTNDTRVCRAAALGGVGCDAQWSDDLHHAIHAFLTKEQIGYYQDFGKIDHVAAALRDGFVYAGQYSALRKRRHGSSSAQLAPEQLVVCSQNHDQVGNRMLGERLTTLVSFESLKIVAGTVLLSPNIPLLFMGEEYGETNPFQYFVDHSDHALVEGVRNGRKEEFASFAWLGEPPDPLSLTTFENSTLNHALTETGSHALLRQYYRKLLELRRLLPERNGMGNANCIVELLPNSELITISRGDDQHSALLVLNFAETQASWEPISPAQTANFQLYSAESAWGGPRFDGELAAELKSQTPILLEPRSLLVFISRSAA